MKVEEKRPSVDEDDQFPVGMRVLAVDDDLTCLKLLETLLQRCQYHVTTTNQAIMALKMLREDKNRFDLVISDVHMPDMDGFKLLELVGLEMDLPVIMLSGNGDSRLVMKGITHGACDYLLKPVRVEELKNIWQHVIRRKKFDSKDPKNLDNPENTYQEMEGGQNSLATRNFDKNAKLNKKRKEQDNEEDEWGEDNEDENEDSTTQKKPRVVWSVELHRKFVAAVNQLGLDKAVPKKILDLMNVETLSRENVASHLQKYRLYLKRLSCVTSEQANVVAAIGGKDPSYLHMTSLDRVGDFHTLSRPRQLPNTAITSFPQGGMLGRLNTPTGLSQHGHVSSGMIQLGHSQSFNNPVNDLVKLQQVIPGNQQWSVLQGMPTSLELDQFQPNKHVSHSGEFSTSTNSNNFSVISDFPNSRRTISSSNNSFLNVPNNSLMLQGPRQQIQSRGAFGNQPSIKMTSHNPESFEIGVGVSFQLSDQGRLKDNWQSAIPLSGYPSNILPSSDSFGSHSSPSNLRDNITVISPHAGSNPPNILPQNGITTSPLDLRGGIHCQAGPIGVNVHDNDPKFLNCKSTSDGSIQNIYYSPMHTWDDHKQTHTHNSSLINSSLSFPAPICGDDAGPLGHNLGQSTAACNGKMDMPLTQLSNFGSPYLLQHNGAEKTSMDTTMKLNEELLLDRTKTQGRSVSTSCGSLEDLMSEMIRQDRDEFMLMDGDISCDVFPLGTCM